MATVSESRFHGLRRPGASLLLKKVLPSRPDAPVLSRKAVNSSSGHNTSTTTLTVDTSASPKIASPSSFQSPVSTEEKKVSAKPLPSPPEARNNEVARPPRASSLSPQAPPEANRPGPSAVANLQLPPASPVRPVSEAFSISQYIPDPEESVAEQPPPAGANGMSEYFPNGSEESVQTHGGDAATITAPYVPPIPDPVIISPLTKGHYECYQSHRAMPVCNNVWYATACMTCHKIDQEDRRRCVFCCLRICTGCFESLQKGRDRSLRELMATLPPAMI